MATVSTDYKRLFVRAIKWTAEDSGLSFYEALKAAARARLTETQTGKVLVSTSGNGKSVTFEIPQSASMTPQAAAELCSEILDRYDAALAALEYTENPESGTAEETAVFNEMMTMLTHVTEVRSSFTDLRCPEGVVTE